MQKDANLVELEKCCQTHIFFAKFHHDRAENEPAKNLQNLFFFCKICQFRFPSSPPAPGLKGTWNMRTVEERGRSSQGNVFCVTGSGRATASFFQILTLSAFLDHEHERCIQFTVVRSERMYRYRRVMNDTLYSWSTT